MVVLFSVLKILVMVGFVFNVAALLTWVDRRQSSMIQDRIGPNRAVLKLGKFELRVAGLLHTAADGVKFFFKEDFMPPNADKLLFSLAPILAMVPVLGLIAVIPFGDTLCTNDIVGHANGTWFWPSIPRYGVCSTDLHQHVYAIDMMVSPLNVGILYVFALAGQGIVGAAIAGWSSDNKFSLMGALRAASQMVSYEVAMGLSLIGAMMVYQTVRLDDMVRWQGDYAWGIFVQPVAFFLFFTAAVAENKRIPFDLPEAESELVSGYFTEYSGMKFGMFYFAEYMEVCTSSMLLVTIFLGGWELPFLHRDGITLALGDNVLTVAGHAARIPLAHWAVELIGVLAFFGKTLLMCSFQAVVRWSLPRFRYDQLMRLGWKVLLPASLVNILATGVIALGIAELGPQVWSALELAASASQALVAAGIVVGAVMFVIGFGSKREHRKTLAGTAAKFAEALGGSKETPMQA
jgi:NADH-quinone oxidoreductase subunit H